MLKSNTSARKGRFFGGKGYFWTVFAVSPEAPEGVGVPVLDTSRVQDSVLLDSSCLHFVLMQGGRTSTLASASAVFQERRAWGHALAKNFDIAWPLHTGSQNIDCMLCFKTLTHPGTHMEVDMATWKTTILTSTNRGCPPLPW